MAKREQKMTGVAIEDAWTPIKVAELPKELRPLAKACGKAMHDYKGALKATMGKEAPEGKEYRFSISAAEGGMEANGDGASFRQYDARRAKAASAPKAAKVNVAALFRNVGGSLKKV